MPLGYTTVSGTALKDASGNPISNATIRFQPVTDKGVPISFLAAGDVPTTLTAVTAQVTGGAFTIQLADTLLTNPINIGYSVAATDNLTGESLLGKGYGCVQPTGATWSFDTYILNLAPNVSVTSGPKGDKGDDGEVTNAALALTQANMRNYETRPMRVKQLTAYGSAPGGVVELFSYIGSGSVERIQVGIENKNALDEELNTITLQVDGRTYTASFAAFFLCYGVTDTSPAPPAAGSPTSINTENITAQAVGVGTYSGFRRIFIPFTYGCRITLNVHGSASSVILWTNVDYYRGAVPAGVHAPTRSCFNMITNEPFVLQPYDTLAVVPAIAGPGEIDSWFHLIKAPAIPQGPTFLESNPSFTIDGETFDLAGGTEDVFGDQFYFTDPARFDEYGVGRFGPSADNEHFYTTMYRYFRKQKMLFNTSLALSWANGDAGSGANAPPALLAGSNAVVYTRDSPALTAPVGTTLIAEWNAANATGGDTAVMTLPDSSGNHVDLTSAGLSLPTPLIVSSSVMGGKPSIRFSNTGSGQHLYNVTSILPQAAGKSRVVFMVLSRDASIPDGTTVVPIRFGWDDGSHSSYQCRIDAKSLGLPGTANLFMWAFDSNTSLIRTSLNGVSGHAATTSPPSSNTDVTQYLGLGSNSVNPQAAGTPPPNYFDTRFYGDIALVRIYDVAPDSQGGAAYLANQIKAMGFGLTFTDNGW